MSVRVGRVLAYLGLALALVEIAAHLGFWATVIVLLCSVLSGMAHYMIGWYSRERMIEKRDPELEELRGRGLDPAEEIYREEREHGMIPEPGAESEDAWP